LEVIDKYAEVLSVPESGSVAADVETTGMIVFCPFDYGSYVATLRDCNGLNSSTVC
jgi:hypothetical protein